MSGTGGAVLAMVVATLLWGATFIVVRDSLDGLSPAALVTARFGAAALALALIALARRRRPSRAALLGGVAGGLAAAGGYLFQAIGLTSTSAGSSAFLTSTGTLFAALFAWPLLGQRPGGRLAVGLVVAMAGSALLGVRDGWRVSAGDLWTLLGAWCFALQIVALARWAKRGDAVVIAGIQAAVAALCTLPAVGDLPGLLARLDGAGWARLAYLTAMGSVVAPLLQVWAQRTLSPGRIGLLFALEPVFALAFALGFGGERFVARWWAGAGLILFSVVGVEWSEARQNAATIPSSTA
jgi:drug/metabolite transporter (DMT)-like permease